jgi:hypothetical protein
VKRSNEKGGMASGLQNSMVALREIWLTTALPGDLEAAGDASLIARLASTMTQNASSPTISPPEIVPRASQAG